MIAAEIIGQVVAAGGQIAADGPDLVLTAPRPLPSELVAKVKAHKPAVLAALARPGGHYGVTVGAETEDLREAFEERAAILEYDAGLPRSEAELEAGRMTATLARNRGYLWPSLRAALAGYPALLSQVPDRPGPVDALPFGVARLAVLKDRRVLRQGEFIHRAT